MDSEKEYVHVYYPPHLTKLKEQEVIMRLVKENIERDGSGTVTLYPEESEDMVPDHFLPHIPRHLLTSSSPSGLPTT